MGQLMARDYWRTVDYPWGLIIHAAGLAMARGYPTMGLHVARDYPKRGYATAHSHRTFMGGCTLCNGLGHASHICDL